MNIWLIIAFPLFAILAWGYCYLVPKPLRRSDYVTIALALAAAVGADAFIGTVTDPGHIWRQIIGFTVAYGVFAAIMSVALWKRRAG